MSPGGKQIFDDEWFIREMRALGFRYHLRTFILRESLFARILRRVISRKSNKRVQVTWRS